MAFEQLGVNYATQYAKELANAYPYLSYFGDIYGGEMGERYKPVSGKTVAIPSMVVSGARAVNRNKITGEFNRNFNNEWQNVTMTMDREWDTIVDPMDIVETNDVATIANVTRTFNETQKIPEMDAYMAMKLAAAATTKDTEALTADNILGVWDNYLAQLKNSRIARDRVRAYLTPESYKLLKQAAGISRFVDISGGGERSVDRNIGGLDGVKIIETPADLMMSAYDFTEGWSATGSAKQINMLFVDPMAVAAPVVYETSMMSPPSAQSKGKYIYYERYYYDVFVLNNRKSGIIVNVEA